MLCGTQIIIIILALGIIVAGGVGNGNEKVKESLEFLDLAHKDKWIEIASLKKPRCCWPQLGFLASHSNELLILSGEDTPSQSVESFNLTTKTWNSESQLLMKRSRSRAIFTDTSVMSEDCAAF